MNINRFNPNQMIVNEYNPGQGIQPHTDHVRLFGDTIVSISLGSPVIMEFILSGVVEKVFLQPRSMIVLTGDSRYLWKHSIPARKTDVYDDQIFHISRRVSLTFRMTK